MKRVINRSKEVLDKKIKQLLKNHPYVSMLLLTIGMPLMMLVSVTLGAATIMLPISLLFDSI